MGACPECCVNPRDNDTHVEQPFVEEIRRNRPQHKIRNSVRISTKSCKDSGSVLTTEVPLSFAPSLENALGNPLPASEQVEAEQEEEAPHEIGAGYVVEEEEGFARTARPRSLQHLTQNNAKTSRSMAA